METRRILVTGADTLIGSHTLNQLLEYDVSVRAVVGSHEQGRIIRQQYSAIRFPRLEIAIVPRRSLCAPGIFNELLRDQIDPFDTIIHTATDISEEADCLARFVSLQNECLLNVLRSIHRTNSRVRRVVVTTLLSPFARWLVETNPGPQGPYRPYSSASNRISEVDPDYILATSQASNNIVYTELWNWMREVRPGFDLAYVTAPSVYGPTMWPLENSSDLEEANRRIWNICSNDSHDRMRSPPYGIDHYTDVRDLALANIEAAFSPQAGNRRFMISAGTMPSGGAMAQYLVGRFPELASRIQSYSSPPGRPLPGRSAGELSDTDITGTILGITQYRTVERTLSDVAQQIVELQGRQDWRQIIQS